MSGGKWRIEKFGTSFAIFEGERRVAYFYGANEGWTEAESKVNAERAIDASKSTADAGLLEGLNYEVWARKALREDSLPEVMKVMRDLVAVALETQKAALFQVIEDRAIHRAHPAEGEVSTGDEPWECVLCGADAEKQDDIQHHVTCPLRAVTGQKAADAGLREAAQALVDKLELIHEDERYQAVWQMYALHGCFYAGPKYEEELKAVRAALGLSADSPKET